MAAISGKLARIRYTAAVPTSSTNQAATLAAGGVTLTINATGRRRWAHEPDNIAVVGATTGTPYAAGGYQIDYGLGRVRFSTAQSTATTYTLDVPWVATSYLGQARSWTLQVDRELLDATGFSTGAAGAKWRTFVPGPADATITVGRFGVDGATGPVVIDRALLNSDFYLELILNSTDQAGYVCYGHVQQDQFTENVGDLVAEQVTFKPSGAIYYTT